MPDLQKKSKLIEETFTKLLQTSAGAAIPREEIENAYLEIKHPDQKSRDAARKKLQWKTVDAHLQAAAALAHVTLTYQETKTNPTTITPVAQTSKFLKRQRDECAEKDSIGRALWALLFQADYLEQGQPFHTARQIRHPAVAEKIESLSKRSRFLALIDAGSTTLAAVTQLLRAPAMPVVLRDGRGNFLRMVRPDLVTNSLEIMDALKKAPQAHGALSAGMIGGEYDWDLHSLSGVSAVQNLTRDQIVADVAIVGLTGVREDTQGFGFGCDNLSESHLKAAFLERAWLKILILQSRKLLPGSELRNFFARLSARQVDVLITDNNPEHRAEIHTLQQKAAKAGVEVLLADSHQNRARP